MKLINCYLHLRTRPDFFICICIYICVCICICICKVFVLVYVKSLSAWSSLTAVCICKLTQIFVFVFVSTVAHVFVFVFVHVFVFVKSLSAWSSLTAVCICKLTQIDWTIEDWKRSWCYLKKMMRRRIISMVMMITGVIVMIVMMRIMMIDWIFQIGKSCKWGKIMMIIDMILTIMLNAEIKTPSHTYDMMMDDKFYADVWICLWKWCQYIHLHCVWSTPLQSMGCEQLLCLIMQMMMVLMMVVVVILVMMTEMTLMTIIIDWWLTYSSALCVTMIIIILGDANLILNEAIIINHIDIFICIVCGPWCDHQSCEMMMVMTIMIDWWLIYSPELCVVYDNHLLYVIQRSF